MAVKINPVIFAPPASILVRLWCMTLRFKRIGYEHIIEANEQGKRLVYAVWHDELFTLGYTHKNQNVVAVVSMSRDGELIGRVFMHFGFTLARGSSSRGGMRALVKAYKQMQNLNADAAFTVVGPRGPRHKVKDGAIFLAKKANALLVPVRVKMYRAKRFEKSWDKFQLPLPFSRCDLFYGVPYPVSQDMEPGQIEKEKKELEQKLNTLTDTVY